MIRPHRQMTFSDSGSRDGRLTAAWGYGFDFVVDTWDGLANLTDDDARRLAEWLLFCLDHKEEHIRPLEDQ
jgi:hypothetical protein